MGSPLRTSYRPSHEPLDQLLSTPTEPFARRRQISDRTAPIGSRSARAPNGTANREAAPEASGDPAPSCRRPAPRSLLPPSLRGPSWRGRPSRLRRQRQARLHARQQRDHARASAKSKERGIADDDGSNKNMMMVNCTTNPPAPCLWQAPDQRLDPPKRTTRPPTGPRPEEFPGVAGSRTASKTFATKRSPSSSFGCFRTSVL